MPRGFPIKWIPQVSTSYFGFLPKFANDTKQTPDKLDDFKSTTSLRFFKKWSGYLTQLLVFEVNDIKYFTVCSKNSIGYDSKYVKEARRLFEPFLSVELVNRMIIDKIHICAEIMSKMDQTHGARVLTESPVVTVIGQTNNNETDDGFVHFLTHEEVVSFCVKYRLPCDSAVIINGNESCIDFLQQLFLNRDFMNNDALENLIRKTAENNPNHVIVQRGTVSHSTILGNRLEGIVFLIVKDDKTIIKKYKFPNYTIATMLYRPEMIDFVFGMHLKKNIDHFVDFWCVSDTGKKYWYTKALQGFLAVHEGILDKIKIEDVGDHIVLCDYLDTTAVKTDIENIFNTESLALIQGTVIIVVGPVGSGKSTMANQICKNNNTSMIFQPEGSVLPSTNFVSTRGTASPKREMSGTLFPCEDPRCDILPSTPPTDCVRAVPASTFMHIDGDVLGLGAELTMSLKAERNAFSLWKIVETLMQGNIPVISTGGGILFNKTKCLLRETIYKTLSINVNLILFVASDSVDQVRVTNNMESAKFLSTTYNDYDQVKNTIIQRVTQNLWKIPNNYKTKKDTTGIDGFTTLIFGKSKENQKFSEMLIEEADSSYAFPIITEKEYEKRILSIENSLLNINIHAPEACSKKKQGKFSQIRILTEIIEKGNRTFVGHITHTYDSSRGISMTPENLDSLVTLGKNF
jgi:shikimate kinase